jgi:hypothetical protein
MDKKIDKQKTIDIICPVCEGKSSKILLSYSDSRKELQCKCLCGDEWVHELEIHTNPEPPTVMTYMEEGTGLIIIDLNRLDCRETTKRSLRIKLPESMLQPTAEGAVPPSVVLGDKK